MARRSCCSFVIYWFCFGFALVLCLSLTFFCLGVEPSGSAVVFFVLVIMFSSFFVFLMASGYDVLFYASSYYCSFFLCIPDRQYDKTKVINVNFKLPS